MDYKSGAVNPIDSISGGSELIQGNYWMLFAMHLVAILIVWGVIFILSLTTNLIVMFSSALLGSSATVPGEVSFVSSFLPQFIAQFIGLFTNIFNITIMGMFFCGIYKALSKTASGATVEFGDLFSGFKFFNACLIFACISSAIQFILGVFAALATVLFGISAFGITGIVTPNGEINPTLVGGMMFVLFGILFVAVIINLVVSALTTFVYPLIAERGMSGMDAITYSIKSGFSNIVGIILLLILLGLIGGAGFLLCIVGFFFAAPLLTASIYTAFQSVFGKIEETRSVLPPEPPRFGEQVNY